MAVDDSGAFARQRELADVLRQRHWRKSELADRFGVSVRTIERDFAAFEERLGHPVPKAKGRFYLEADMQPIRLLELSAGEARTLLFAMRMLMHSSVEQDRDAASLLDKLAVAFPGPIARQVAITRRQLAARPANAKRAGVLSRLTDAWVRGGLVCMTYRAVDRRAGRMFCFEPYVLEPSRSTGATYVIGHNHTSGHTGTYKLDRIATIDAHPAVCPLERKVHEAVAHGEADELMERMGRSWSGIVLAGEEQHEIVLEFANDAARRVREGPWHETRTVEELDGDGVRLRLTLPATFDFLPWVLSWGKDAVVVEPRALRDLVAEAHASAAAAYRP